jgi:apolipoprotein N-acyltransferase
MILLVLCSALLLSLSFPNDFNNYGFSAIAWFFAIPLFFALEKAKMPRRFIYGIVFGLTFYSSLILWFRAYSLPGYVFFTLVLSAQPLMFSVFYLPPTRKKIWQLFYPSALWVSAEFLRKMCLNGFSWDLGHSQAFDLAAVQTASLLGSSGMSFLIMAFNQCGYRFLKEKEGRKRMIVLMILILGGVYGYGSWVSQNNPQNSEKIISVLALQPNINYAEKLDQKNVDHLFQKQLTLTRKALAKFHPDLIVWPETAVPTDVLDHKVMSRQLEDLARSSQSGVLVGTALDEGEKNFNSAVLWNSEGHLEGRYHKRRLVPFTEYLPLGRLGQNFQEVLEFHPYDFTAGSESGIFEIETHQLAYERTTFGVLICSEDTLSQFFRQYALKKAQFVVVLLNDGWFADKKALILHAQNAVMHAVENRLPVLRVANTGWSCYIDAYGRVKSGVGQDHSESFNKEMALEFALQPHPEITLANHLGDSLSWVCLGYVFLTLWLRFLKRAHDA